nr:hypothetical protein [uncultured Carboxylicivirga sp.]
MNYYIDQLLELIHAATNTDSSISNDMDEDNYINEFADQYIHGTPIKISEKTGLEKFQFPPIGKLTTEQISILLPEIEDLLLSYNWEFIFPEGVTDEIKYNFIIEKWDTKHIYCNQGIVQIETCKFDDKKCPFPGHCSICNKFTDDTSHALCKGQVDFDSLTPNFEMPTTPEMRKNIDRFKELMRTNNTSEYIAGIHNYCDGRCDKCKYSNRCSSYALNEEMSKAAGDENSSEDHLMMILKATTEFIEEELEKRGIDPVEKMNEISSCDAPINKEKHPLELEAESYAEKVKRWLDSNQREMESRIISDNTHINKYFKSITWFQLFIPTKINRALNIFRGGHNDSTDEYDSNGSAKAALLGIDESIWAWEKLMHEIPQKEDSILNILLHLSNIRTELENLLPKAREFKRPGFDTE